MMSQPVFKQQLEEDLVQRVGTKLTLEVQVEESSEKVFFEWRGPAGSNVEDGRVAITESGSTSTAEITPLHLQVREPEAEFISKHYDHYVIVRTRECGHARLKIRMASHKQGVTSSPKVKYKSSFSDSNQSNTHFQFPKATRPPCFWRSWRPG